MAKDIFFFVAGLVSGFSIGVIIRDFFSSPMADQPEQPVEVTQGSKGATFFEPISDKEIMEIRINQLTKNNG